MKEKTCCFSGHREITDNTDEIKLLLKQVLISLINCGIIYFGAGGARGFDALAAQTVLELKKLYPQIKLILVLPCPDQTIGWDHSDIRIYERIKKDADKIRVLSEYYYNGCMLARNRHLVNCSSVCVCYKRKSYGGTAYTVRYAIQRGLRIIKL